MATNNFLVFNEDNSNVLTNEQYATDTQRVSGVTPGKAKSTLHNKLYRQVSIMVSAIGQVITNSGLDANDSNFANLVSAIQSVFKDAVNISFNKTIKNKLVATTVQAAIDELTDKKADLVDGKIPKAQLPSVGGAIVSATAPADTDLLWIDTSAGGILKYYSTSTSNWITVKYAYE